MRRRIKRYRSVNYRHQDPPRAPFPYWGGKRRAASLVWQLLGKDIYSYVDPFGGSMAIPLNAPLHLPRVVVNDRLGLLVNAWRALQAEPEATAYHADYPTSHLDLIARNAELRAALPEVEMRVRRSAHWHDVRLAGWYMWAVSNSIDMGTSLGDGCGTKLHDGNGVMRGARETPGAGGFFHHGRGVAKGSRVNMRSNGGSAGVGGLRPARMDHGSKGRKGTQGLSDGGYGSGGSLVLGGGLYGRNGLARQDGIESASIVTGGGYGRRSIARQETPAAAANLYTPGLRLLPWFRQLQAIISRWLILCQDWRKIVNSPSTLAIIPSETSKRTALVLDPPYDDDRSGRVYTHDDSSTAAEVRLWLMTPNKRLDGIAPWHNPRLRIVYCGYDGDFSDKELPGATKHHWHRGGGMEAQRKGGTKKERLETLWASPSCLLPGSAKEPEGVQQAMF